MTRGTTEAEIAAVFERADARGFLHAIDVENGNQVGLGSDTSVVTASVFKIPVLLEVVRQADHGRFALTDRVTVSPEQRVMGPTGISVMQDTVELSIRDLAFWMMSVSDNTATDVLMDLVGMDAINATLRDLGLTRTVLEANCRILLTELLEDVGPIEDPELFDFATLDPEIVNKARALDAERTTRTTPREIAQLLTKIWRDEAASPEACAEARRIMYLQVWPHRLRSGFGDDATIGAKTGTLPGIRNEAGVVEFKGGGRYAVGVFTRTDRLTYNEPVVDASIGAAAAIAVRALRGA